MARQASRWTITLTHTQITALSVTARAFIQSGQPITSLRKEDFPLISLAEQISSLQADLIDGIGFQLIKGLNPEQFSREEMEVIFVGMGTHLGNQRPQNAQGDLLGHVRDAGKSSDDANVRIYQTSERQHFHTDSADVVGLLCLQPALEGGQSLLVSAETIYNEMLRHRPDLLQLLLEPIATDRRGEVPPGMKPYTLIPVFCYHEQRLTVYYQRQYIESAQRFADAPRLTDKHLEALDLFDRLCNDPRLHLTMQLQSGDMQFVYNHSLLHDRTGFTDHPDPEKKRYLRRLWLSIPGDRELPQVFSERYGSLLPGSRGGVFVA